MCNYVKPTFLNVAVETHWVSKWFLELDCLWRRISVRSEVLVEGFGLWIGKSALELHLETEISNWNMWFSYVMYICNMKTILIRSLRPPFCNVSNDISARNLMNLNQKLSIPIWDVRILQHTKLTNWSNLIQICIWFSVLVQVFFLLVQFPSV